MKTILIIIVFISLAVLLKAQTVTPGVVINHNFVTIDQLRDSLRRGGKSYFLRGFWEIFPTFWETARVLKLDIPVAFRLKIDRGTNYVSIDSLFPSKSKFYWYFSEKDISKITSLLIESITKDSPVTWDKKKEWRQLGFLWGQNMFYEMKISYKHPYSTEVITCGEPEAEMETIITKSFLFFLLFFSISNLFRAFREKYKID